jgi:hypothetical protein
MTVLDPGPDNDDDRSPTTDPPLGGDGSVSLSSHADCITPIIDHSQASSQASVRECETTATKNCTPKNDSGKSPAGIRRSVGEARAPRRHVGRMTRQAPAGMSARSEVSPRQPEGRLDLRCVADK